MLTVVGLGCANCLILLFVHIYMYTGTWDSQLYIRMYSHNSPVSIIVYFTVHTFLEVDTADVFLFCQHFDIILVFRV